MRSAFEMQRRNVVHKMNLCAKRVQCSHGNNFRNRIDSMFPWEHWSRDKLPKYADGGLMFLWEHWEVRFEMFRWEHSDASVPMGTLCGNVCSGCLGMIRYPTFVIVWRYSLINCYVIKRIMTTFGPLV